MEIVPDNAALVIQAQVAPNDADDLTVGQETEVRFSSLHERRLPILKGRLTKLSADAYTDDKGRQFYRAEVSISPENLTAIKRVRGSLPGVRPGLPVEVIVPLRNRTALAYLMEPLGNALWRSFREN
jgi:multidrug efflux pump subunit AcrA (membrane-fusion protein)